VASGGGGEVAPGAGGSRGGVQRRLDELVLALDPLGHRGLQVVKIGLSAVLPVFCRSTAWPCCRRRRQAGARPAQACWREHLRPFAVPADVTPVDVALGVGSRSAWRM